MRRVVFAWCLSAAAVVLTAVVLFTFAFRQDDVCTQVENLRTAVRTILVNGKNATLVSPDVTPVQRVALVKFYDIQLALVTPHRC